MRVVFFLGAGFSEPFDHPLMDSFFSYADGSNRLDDEDRDFLGRLLLETRKANSFLESSPTNLEDILSFAVMGERLGLAEAEKQAAHIREIIRKVYTTSPQSGRYWPRYSPLPNLLGNKIENIRKNLSFVTTNYDINIESACYNFSAHTNPGFPLDRKEVPGVQFYDAIYNTSGIPLYKLHGSVNWFSGEADKVYVEDRIEYIEPIEDKRFKFPWVCSDSYIPPNPPVIVRHHF